MNKIILVCALLTSVCGLKAQKLTAIKPADSLLNPSVKNYFKPLPNNNHQLLQPGLNFNHGLNTAQTLALNYTPFYSRMPVVVLNGYSRMPVVRLNGDDKMPVAKTDPVNPDIKVPQHLPEIPTFINPYSPVIK